MRKQDVEIGAVYTAKVSGKVQEIRIIAARTNGLTGRTEWIAENISTGREVRVRSAARLRRKV